MQCFGTAVETKVRFGFAPISRHWRAMGPALAAFLFGFLAGFVMLRLARDKPLAAWERRVLRPLGWALMAASLTFAVALLGWALLRGGLH